jgi:hypothetical protein
VLQIRDVYLGSRIRIFPSQIWGRKDPGSGSATKNYISPIKVLPTKLSENDMRLHLRSRIQIFFHPDADPGVEKSPDPDPQHRILVPTYLLNRQKVCTHSRHMVGSDRIRINNCV